MPDGDKTLRETIQSVVSETQDTDTKTTETNEGISEGNSGETNAGETPEFVSGIDINKLPAEERAVARKVLSEKGKLLEEGYQGKFKDVANLKRIKEDLEKAGLSEGEVSQVLGDYLKKKNNPTATSETKEKALRTLDKLIESSPYEQKSQLEQFRTIIKEESDNSELKQTIAEMKKQIELLSGTAVQTQKERLTSETKTLEEKYGKELIDKVRDDIIDKALKYNVSARRVLVGDYTDEAEQALLAMSTKGKKPLTTEKKNAISSEGSGVTVNAEKKADSKKPWNQFIRDLNKK